jgi:16S rRNA processing protein RimM
LTLVTAGRVGKPHGRDGSFHVEGASHPLPLKATLILEGRPHEIERRAGTDTRPLIRLSGVEDPGAVRGALLLVDEQLGNDEWLASDLLDCIVRGRGRVVRVVEGPSCSILEIEDGTLIPFISDAIRSVRPGEIDVNEEFLG